MVYPFTQTAEPALAAGFIATNYRHHHHMGQGLITLVPATLGGTARAWRSAYPSIPGVALPGKDIAHRLLLGAASDGNYPCLPKWVRLIWVLPG